MGLAHFTPFAPLSERASSQSPGSWQDWCNTFDHYARIVNPKISAFTHRPRTVIGCPVDSTFSSYKDMIAVKHFTSRLGTESLSIKPSASARIVDDLEARGMFTLGKVRTTEFGVGDNHLDCVNPLFPQFTPGGSSNGSAVAVASGISDISFGTDAAGSIRRPASNCGVVGLLFSPSQQYGRGVFPVSSSLERIGAIARTLDDMIYVWNAHRLAELYPQQRAGLERVSLIAPYLPKQVDREIVQAFDRYVLQTRAAGIPVERVDWGVWPLRHHGWKIIAYELNRLFTSLEDRFPVGLRPSTRLTIESGRSISSDEYEDACENRRTLSAEINTLLMGDGFVGILLPVDPRPVAQAQVSGVRIMFPEDNPSKQIDDWTYTVIANICNLCAIAYPIQISADGFPIGVQILGPERSEEVLIHVAKVLSASLPDWIDPAEIRSRRQVFEDIALYATEVRK